MPTPSKPLDGVKVLDLSRVLSGPFCASMLADLGASVTKIEIPERGDDSRAFSPHVNDESTYFMLVNRGKKSVTVNMKTSKGIDLIRGLLKNTDILVENFRPGVMKKLGLDYDTVKAINPGLIYASISGFGQDGPIAHRAAYDHIVQAMGGIMSSTGWPESAPTRVGDAIGDVVAGLYAAWGIMAALFQRTRTGSGQHVDVAMLDAIISLQMVSLSQIIGGATPPGRIGNSHQISAPMDSFAAADGNVVIAVANDALFAKLAFAIGQQALIQDPRYATDAQRFKNQNSLRGHIESWSAHLSVEDIVTQLERAGVPVAPIWDLSSALASDHAHHRRLLRSTQHPNGGTIQVMPQPVKLSHMAESDMFSAPLLGAHTNEILAQELGLSDEDIAELHAEGII